MVDTIEKMNELIEDCKKLIEIKDNDLINLDSIKNQIEVEEYKELNPGKNIFKI
ncbi:hypothetical protein HN014_22505 (plasmid) [Aquimarina sp. TRL1]|uniref:hypothetical protein n=1 Tax=Aquimarina sp. (strain TRL1) TaxID=2736252 RepID=UPI0015882EF9|nr:hypothetical protein [Aquimarina sp. TRL1]QKX07774.1 hypothetical protein HN014_22505 [Aquimarina sp. TRL1]